MNILSKLSGIYKITALHSKEFYVGSAVNLRKRQSNHLYDLLQKQHANKHLQNIYDKYGKDNLIWSVLLFCEVETLIYYEQYYIDQLNPVINKCPVAGSWLGSKHSTETIHRLSQIQRNISEETRRRRSESLKGKTPSEETRRKLSQAKRNISEETRHKLSVGHLKTPIPKILQHIKTWQISGVSQRSYALSNSIAYPTFWYWVKKYSHLL